MDNLENAGLQQKTQKPRNQNIEIGTEIGTKNRKRQIWTEASYMKLEIL